MENEPQDAYLPSSEDEILQPFDAREQSSRRGMMYLLGGFLLLLVLAFIVLSFFSDGTRNRDQTPRILAEDKPYKAAPADAGGAQTPNQDKKIYDVLKGEAGNEVVTNTQSPEIPMAKPKPSGLGVATLPATVPSAKPAANIVIKEDTPVKPVPRPAVSTLPSTGNSDYVVQVASLRSQAEASSLWDKVSGKFSSNLSASNYADIKRVDLNAKGIYYRLRVAGLLDKADADRLCRQFKAASQDCIVTRK